MFYPEDVIEEVRRSNDIVDVISSYVKLQKKGSNHMGLCPFHGEKTPSFSVSQSRQMYHCFGCGVGGNVFTFLMEYENLTFPEAVKSLAERAGIKLPEQEYSPEAKRAADRKTRLLEVNKLAAKYYFYQLSQPNGAAAYRYFKGRGLTDETIKHFGLGYSNKTSDDLYQYLKRKGYEDGLLKDSGLVTMNESKGVYDKFWNRAMFPIMDANNKVIGFGGRVMGEGMPKYLNSPETPVFDKSRNLYGLNFAKISRKDYMLICEGYMDVIALHQAGFTNAVASLGTALTGLQANLLKRYTSEVLLTYDSDGAGVKAAMRAIPILKEAGMTVRVISLAPYKDPDEFIKGLGADEFQKRIDNALNSFYFEISVLERDYDMADPEDKTKFYNAVAKKLLVFGEEIERNNYTEAIAKRYGIRFEDLRRLVNTYGARLGSGEEYQKRPVRNTTGRKRPEDGLKQSQMMLLAWLGSDRRIFDKLAGVIGPEDFTEPLCRQVADMLFEQYQNGDVVPATVINHFDQKEEQSQAAAIFAADIGEDLGEMERERALNETVKRVKRNALETAGQSVTDFAELQKIALAMRNLQNLHISLKDG
ncbi:DNA primase [Anaerolentibacter hominis]|uniref:DNA primase n=1 Tax=Anaerolentibacter hominis TaxID=3079009 RepID=UPI0031B89F4A